MSTAKEIATALGSASREGRGNWRAKCPIHGGVSLTLADGRDGKLLVNCFGGCDSKDVLAELRRRNLLSEPERCADAKVIAAYDYTDESGSALFQVCRLALKDFRQRRPNGARGWTWNTEGVRKVPYRLPDIVAAAAQRNGQPPRIYVVEGEKDADRLRQQWGLLATTNPGGAGKWRSDYNQYFPGFDVIILPDNDEPGRKHAEDVARNLGPVAASVRIVELPGLPPKGDVSDWLDRNGDARQSDLEILVEVTEPFQPRTPNRANYGIGIVTQTGEGLTMEKIEWLWPGWLARGKFHLLAGGKGAGKSTILFDLMARITAEGATWPDGTLAPTGDVMIWSGEDGIRDTILPRFYAAGGVRSRIHFPLVTRVDGQDRPFDPSIDINMLIDKAAQMPQLLFVAIDPVVLAIPSRSDSHKNSETRRGLQPLVEFAEQRGIALVGVTHFTKGTQDRDPIERVTGSLAFGALPRCVWGASADEDDYQRRLVRIASNIGPNGGGIEYTLYQAPLPDHDFSAQRVDWGPQLKGSARELLNAAKRSAEAEAVAFLTTFLADGPKPQKEVKTAADAHCHAWMTIRRAQLRLGIKPKQVGKAWLWELPPKPNTFRSAMNI
jgi:hypothetical protein